MAKTNNQFKADVLQIGNLKRSITETTDGDLIFRDKFHPYGLRLKDLSGEEFYESLVALSGNLQVQITQNTEDIIIISDDLAALSGQVENLTFLDLEDTPDSYSGAEGFILAISGGKISFVDAGDIETDLTNVYEKIDAISAQSDQNASDIANFIGGQIDLSVDQNVYTISNSNITTQSNPVCTIVAPLSGEINFGINIFSINNGSFTVETTMGPPITGYKLNWMAFVNF